MQRLLRCCFFLFLVRIAILVECLLLLLFLEYRVLSRVASRSGWRGSNPLSFSWRCERRTVKISWDCWEDRGRVFGKPLRAVFSPSGASQAFKASVVFKEEKAGYYEISRRSRASFRGALERSGWVPPHAHVCEPEGAGAPIRPAVAVERLPAQHDPQWGHAVHRVLAAAGRDWQHDFLPGLRAAPLAVHQSEVPAWSPGRAVIRSVRLGDLRPVPRAAPRELHRAVLP